MNSIGLAISICGLVIAVFTSNLVISRDEKKGASNYRRKKASGEWVTKEEQYAALSVFLHRACWAVIFAGLIVFIIEFATSWRG